MIIETLTWGKIDVSEEQVYYFSKGIPGFEEETDFAIIPVEDGPFCYLQSLKKHNLSFLLSDPFVFHPTYEFELPESYKEELGIDESVLVRCIVTIKEELEKSTVNLLAPIVLNPDSHLGRQVVLHNSIYETKHSLWDASRDKVNKAGE